MYDFAAISQWFYDFHMWSFWNFCLWLFCDFKERVRTRNQWCPQVCRLAPSLVRSLFGPIRSTVRCLFRSLRLLHLCSGLPTEWAWITNRRDLGKSTWFAEKGRSYTFHKNPFGMVENLTKCLTILLLQTTRTSFGKNDAPLGGDFMSMHPCSVWAVEVTPDLILFKRSRVELPE